VLSFPCRKTTAQTLDGVAEVDVVARYLLVGPLVKDDPERLFSEGITRSPTAGPLPFTITYACASPAAR
jgi:hypothetical protein